MNPEQDPSALAAAQPSAPTQSAGIPAKARKAWRPWATALAYAGVAALAYRSIDHASFLAGISRLRISHVFLLVGVALLHIAGRAVRFDRLMRRAGANESYHFAAGIRIFLVGLSASAVTPGRAGDLIKAQLVRPYGVALNRGVGLVLVERVLDLLVICTSIVVSGAVLSRRASSDTWRAVALAFLLGLIVLVVVLAVPAIRTVLLRLAARIIKLFVRSLDEQRILQHLNEIFVVWDDVFHSFPRLLAQLAGSMCAWCIEFMKLWLVLGLLGASIDPVLALFVYPISIVAGILTLLPISEAVVGVTGAMLLHALGGVDTSVAAIAIVVDRATSVLTPLGLWALFALTGSGASPVAAVEPSSTSQRP
ncbi:MAG TPA: lysylphosphatidylglycerol synthase transmembrane domain-containing protein [Polyangiales bacterium]